MCAEPPYVLNNFYGVITLGANTLYINFYLFKEISMASKALIISRRESKDWKPNATKWIKWTGYLS